MGLALTALAIAACERTGPAVDADSEARGGRLYVTSGLTDQVFRLDPETGELLSRFDLDVRRDEIDEPHGIAVSPDGRHWYATIAHGNPTLWKFELLGDRLVGRLQLGARGAARVGLTTDGKWAFVPDYDRAAAGAVGAVAVVRTHDLHLVGLVPVCPAPHDAQASPDGSLVALTCTLSDEIALMDTESLAVERRFAVGEEADPTGPPSYKPLNVVWAPDGAFLHVTLGSAGTVRTFSRSGETLGSVTVGDGPTQLASTRDGRLLVTANRLDGSASVVQVTPVAAGGVRLREMRRVDLGAPFPHGAAITPDGGLAFITFEGDSGRPAGVLAISTADGRVVWRTEVGAYLLGVAFHGEPDWSP